MKKSVTPVLIALFALAAPDISAADNLVNDIPRLKQTYRESLGKWNSLDIAAVDAKGRPTFITGNLGKIESSANGRGLSQLNGILNRYLKAFDLQSSDLAQLSDWTDEYGYRNLHYEQVLHGLRLEGSSVSVLIAPSGEICSISSNLTDEHARFVPKQNVNRGQANSIASVAAPTFQAVSSDSDEPLAKLDHITGDIWYVHAVKVKDKTGHGATVYVDAANGNVLGVVSDERH